MKRNNIRPCGNDQNCFEKGECWGHFEFELCKHLHETENNLDFCKKYDCIVQRKDNR